MIHIGKSGSDTCTIVSIRSSGSNLISPTSSLDSDLALILSDASVTDMNNFELSSIDKYI